ncbi:MAG: kynureninase, partial [Cyclobacteriaceae bacterium]|nr:kynureninase [Cyclobacteriaceae bacterium]
MINYNSLDYARKLDKEDSLGYLRREFYFPETEDGTTINYFCGNSLGLQPLSARKYVEEVMESWQKQAVDGHFNGENPWCEYQNSLAISLSKIVGAKPFEVGIANTLTVNLHLMMVSFYRPKGKRFKILVESDLFPSDLYAIESQLRYHGLDPEDAIIKVYPDDGPLISKGKIEEIINDKGESIALILLGGVNYYTGQVFDLKSITSAGHEKGCVVGLDLAHAAGNIELELHSWGVDFAVWCNYKYLNSGPGSIAGYFVHERYAFDQTLPRFAGWWGQSMDTRFNMRKPFDPIPGAEGWVMSNPPILAMASIKASMEIFDSVPFTKLREKSVQLTGYLEELIVGAKLPGVTILTPQDPEQRGCQLSLHFEEKGRTIFEYLHKSAVITDWREPNVIRVA